MAQRLPRLRLPRLELPRLAVGLLLAFLGHHADASAQNIPRKADEIANAFVELTMTAEYIPKSGAPLTLTRWEKPVTWALLGDAPKAVEQSIVAALERVSLLTQGKVQARYVKPAVLRPEGAPFLAKDTVLKNAKGIHTSLVVDTALPEQPVVVTYSSPTHVVAAAANLMILYGEAAYLAKIAKVLPSQPTAPADDIARGTAECMAYTWTSKERKDIAYTAIMLTDRLTPERLQKCIAEEIGQVLGIRNDFKDAAFSVFTNNTAQRFDRWTPFDEAVIRMLYDPEMTVGMSVEEVRAAARRLAPKYFGSFLQ